MIEPETDVERAIVADPDWQRGVAYGARMSGHPEASVRHHVEDVLANLEGEPDRSRLRVIALVHDACKDRVRWWLPGRTDHARLARRLAERHVSDPGVLKVVARHDDAFRAWRFGRRTGLWPVSRWLARRLVRDLGAELPLFLAFYRADNATGDKSPDDRLWFEALL